MRSLFLLVGVLCSSFSDGLCSTDWPNEPAGSVNVLDCPFAGNVCNMSNNVGASFVTDASAPMGGTKQALDNYLAPNSTTGNGTWVYGFPNKPKAVYVGTWWKTNPEFDGNVNSGNKMIFVQGAGAGGGGNFIMWYGPVEGDKEIRFATQQDQPFGAGNCHLSNWQSYSVCQSNTTWPNGTHGFFYNNMGSGYVGPGSGWHKIETYQKSSTTYTSRDGIIKMWLDGRLILDVQTANLLPNGFTDVQYNTTWDGSSNYQCNVRDCSRARHHYYDHLRISFPPGVLQPVTISNDSLPTGNTGTKYVAVLKAAGGYPPYTWSLESGTLPTGLTFFPATGFVSGTPTEGGRMSLVFKAVDGLKATGTKTLTLTVNGASAISARKAQLQSHGIALTTQAALGRVSFDLEFQNQGKFSIGVFDLHGRNVWNYSASTGKVPFAQAIWNHGSRLSKGVYLVRVEQGGKTMSVNYCHMW